jgi:hypothetical protein
MKTRAQRPVTEKPALRFAQAFRKSRSGLRFSALTAAQIVRHALRLPNFWNRAGKLKTAAFLDLQH